MTSKMFLKKLVSEEEISKINVFPPQSTEEQLCGASEPGVIPTTKTSAHAVWGNCRGLEAI
jgi:hypothetical protein